MKIQLWYCNVCEVTFAVSDVERVKVTCTGGHPQAEAGALTPDHWPTVAQFDRLVGVETGATVADVWPGGYAVLPEGKRFEMPDASPDVAAGASWGPKRAEGPEKGS